ncbi:MAG TPA: hypothetical protein VFS08_03220 [Gemmatimonadaceae bacterium]|nr:hypothetical protein [Gemmatimonadaceae bacterium]
MRAVRRLAAGLSAAALALAPRSAALAQGPVAQDCDYRVVSAMDTAALGAAARGAHPDVAYAGMLPRIAAGEWLVLADSLVADVAAETRIPAPAWETFRRQLQALRDELAFVAASADPARLRTLARGVTLERFRITPPTAVEPESAYVLFVRGPEPIALGALPGPARRALCWRAMAIGRMLAAYGGLARAEATAALQAAARQWDAYGETGYSQYPWELAINGARFDASAIAPPRTQLVVLHPALALELSAPALDELERLERTDAITVEPIGIIRYTASRRMYYGLSALVSLPGDGRVGTGLLAHLGTYGQVGAVLFRARDETGSRGRSVVVSADLYQFLAGMPAAIRDARTRALGTLRDSLLARLPTAPP